MQKQYENRKVNDVIDKLVVMEFTEQDFADLAVAAADQAGLSRSDQSLFKQLLTAAIEESKHRRTK